MITHSPHIKPLAFRTGSVPERSPAWGLLAIFIALIGLQLIAGFLTYESTLTFDESIWQYIGRNWFRLGRIPYAGGVDNKSPLIFAVFGLSDKLFGVNYWFPRLLGIGFQSLGLIYVYKTGKLLFNRRTGLLAFIIYGFSIAWHSAGGKYVSYTECYGVCFTILAVYLCLSPNRKYAHFLGGIMAGLGIMFRISAIFGFLAIFLYLLLKKRRKLIPFVSGMSISILIIAIFLSMAGIRISDIFLFALTDNFGYGSVTDQSLFWKMNVFFNHFFYSELVLFFPGVIGFLSIKRCPSLLLFWLIAEFLGILMLGLFSTQHFKSILPALSLINAFSVAWLIEHYTLPVKQSMLVVFICFFPKLLEPLVAFKGIFHFSGMGSNAETVGQAYPETDQTKKLLGLWIKSNTTPETRVFIAGFGAIAQAYSERLSPSVYFNVTQTQRARKVFFNEMNLHTPDMICIPAFSTYIDYVRSDIRDFITELSTCKYDLKYVKYGYHIYLKKNNSPGFIKVSTDYNE
jgi:4-amino-4-deoxy-L-arabinose transferase-like glycosyltransferase